MQSLYAIPTDEFENLLNEIKDLKNFLKNFRLENTPPSIPETGNIELAIKVLKRSKSWIYKKTAEGELPHRKFNSTLLFDRKELEKYLSDHINEWEDEITVSDNIRLSANKKINSQFKRKK